MVRSLHTHVEQSKTARKASNLHQHVLKAERRVRQVGTPWSDNQLEFFAEWAENVQEIDPEDAKLSGLWEELLVRVAQGEQPSAELVRCLKTLTPGEAAYLLSLQHGGRAQSKFMRLLPWKSRSDTFYERALLSKQLVSRSSLLTGLFVAVAFAALVGLGYYLYVYKSWHWYDLADRKSRRLVVLAILAGTAFILSPLGLYFHRLKLSWLGEELTRHAPAIKE